VWWLILIFVVLLVGLLLIIDHEKNNPKRAAESGQIITTWAEEQGMEPKHITECSQSNGGKEHSCLVSFGVTKPLVRIDCVSKGEDEEEERLCFVYGLVTSPQ